MECITTPWYTLSLNGASFGYFKGARGIRQGDPMSPLIFTICMEYLSRVLQEVTSSLDFNFYPMYRALKFSHLCFADDLLLFCRGDKMSIVMILRAFATFSVASGLEMNSDKSDIYFNGMADNVVSEVLRYSGYKEGCFPFKYLGIPISYKRMQIGDCTRLVEKVVGRIRSWGARKLSYAGRLTLIRQYSLNCIPTRPEYSSYLCQSLIGLSKYAEIIYGLGLNYMKVPLVSWKQICNDKKAGGLGIINCRLWNIELLGKYVWWLASKSDHLWIPWVSRVYLKGRDWLGYFPTANTSWTWRKICQVRDQMRDGYNGARWCANNGVYSVSHGYDWLQGEKTKVNWRLVIWNRLSPPKHSFIGWMVIQGRLLTKDRLLRYGLENDGYCELCQDTETMLHLLYGYTFSKRCWDLLADWLGQQIPEGDVLQWCIRWRCSSLRKKKVVYAVVLALIYKIWHARNVCRIKHKVIAPRSVVDGIRQIITDRCYVMGWM